MRMYVRGAVTSNVTWATLLLLGVLSVSTPLHGVSSIVNNLYAMAVFVSSGALETNVTRL